MLPNTAGCRSVREAVTTAKLARELFGTSWIKLEVIADNDTLQPDVVGLVEAATILIKDGFEVFPYCTEDLSVAQRLVDAGCRVVMPWAAPIGSARGIVNRDALKLLRDRLPDITLVVDAGLGAPSHAAEAMELGYDAVLLNTAIAKAEHPVAMARAFKLAVDAGRIGYEAGLMGAARFRLALHSCDRDTVLACRILTASTPIVDSLAWVKRLAALGVGTVQLRAKDLDDGAALQLVTDALAAVKGTPTKLVINDYWRAAIVAGAQHLHLGQEDLAEADLHEIRKAGLTLGLSTHDDAELETALAAQPDYIALGPIFPTTLKSMRFAPQGIPKITDVEEARRHHPAGRDRRHQAGTGRRRFSPPARIPSPWSAT